MLCDMKDLAQCALVNSQWAEAASNLLYVVLTSFLHIKTDSLYSVITISALMLFITATGKKNWPCEGGDHPSLAGMEITKILRRSVCSSSAGLSGKTGLWRAESNISRSHT